MVAILWGLQLVPSLEKGNRLGRAEFERRREATSAKLKAEPIERVVYGLY